MTKRQYFYFASGHAGGHAFRAGDLCWREILTGRTIGATADEMISAGIEGPEKRLASSTERM